MANRLVLGTASLGMPYGIWTKAGKPDFRGACDIVKAAFDNGIACFDTAQSYGDSEEVLGRVFEELALGTRAGVYSKLHANLDLKDESAIRSSVDDSLRKLRLERLEGLLVHREDGMNFWDEGLGRALRDLVTQGKVRKIGASFYSPQKALSALDRAGLDFVQAPANIFDRRFEDAGVFRKARECGKEVFIRSVFLQGLLLMPLERVPVTMKYVLPYLQHLERMASDMKLSRHELAAAYVSGKWPASPVLFGVHNAKQVEDTVRAFSLPVVAEIDESIFKNIPENILNPALWPRI